MNTEPLAVIRHIRDRASEAEQPISPNSGCLSISHEPTVSNVPAPGSQEA